MRLRGRTDLGTTFLQVLYRYGAALAEAGSKLVLVSASEQIQGQLRAAGVTDVIGPQDIYAGDERVGATFKRGLRRWHRMDPGQPAPDRERYPGRHRAGLRLPRPASLHAR